MNVHDKPESPPRYLPSLDAARFICALIVTMAHTGQPPLRDGIDTVHPIGFAIHGFLSNATSSAAAVICFFVISGIVIHYPNTQTLHIQSLPSFFARRYIRIIAPVLVAVVIAQELGVSLSLFGGTILWSLAAELIYYTLYPLLLAARRRTPSWLPLLIVSYLAAFGVAATDPSAGEYPSFGTALNWLLGLPCWLLGCLIAERIAKADNLTQAVRWIWAWRAAVFLGAALSSVLRYHTPLGYPWTLNIFALLAGVWLYMEVRNGFTDPLPRWLGWSGLWSYSLYLFHKLAVAIFDRLWSVELGPVLGWTWRFASILALSYLAYLLIERPSHLAARALARYLEARRQRAAVIPLIER
jgi:peptidoglycan/LPS O-acetylase OafA/YrhL